MAKGYKTGGRRKGSLNRVTSISRELLTVFMAENFDSFKEAMSKLEPIDFVRTYISIIKYVVPALQSEKITLNDSEHKTIEDILSELAQEY